MKSIVEKKKVIESEKHPSDSGFEINVEHYHALNGKAQINVTIGMGCIIQIHRWRAVARVKEMSET